MTIYSKTSAHNSCALKPNEVYITQREKIKDFHDLAELTFKRRSRLWKPSTLWVNRDCLKNQILPFFKTHASTATPTPPKPAAINVMACGLSFSKIHASMTVTNGDVP